MPHDEQDGMGKIDLDKLPWFYRLILKIPGIEALEKYAGIFWTIIIPILLILEFWFTLMLLVSFGFPVNIILAAIIPTAVFITFVRLKLERSIRGWNSANGKSHFEWNVEKSTEEYLILLKKKEKTDE